MADTARWREGFVGFTFAEINVLLETAYGTGTSRAVCIERWQSWKRRSLPCSNRLRRRIVARVAANCGHVAISIASCCQAQADSPCT